MAISRLIDCPHKPNPIAATTNRSAGLHLSCGGVCPKEGGLEPTFIYTRSPAAISSYSIGLGVGLASQSFPGKINLLMVPTSLSHSKKKGGGRKEEGKKRWAMLSSCQGRLYYIILPSEGYWIRLYGENPFDAISGVEVTGKSFSSRARVTCLPEDT